MALRDNEPPTFTNKSFEYYLYMICTKCITVNNGFTNSYLYDNVKSNIKWLKLKPKQFLNYVMAVSDIVHLNEDDFRKWKTSLYKEKLTAVSLREQIKENNRRLKNVNS